MPAFFPEAPRSAPDHVRDYIVACVRAARPSPTRDEALRLLGEVDLHDAWDVPPHPIDWDEVEAEAARQGCTVADVVFDRAGRRD